MVDMHKLLLLQGTLFLLMTLGILFRRWKIVDESFQKGLTELIVDLVLPCNIVASFLVELDAEILRTSSATLLISAGIQLFCWFLDLFLFRRLTPGETAVAQYSTICSNANFLGVPVVEGIWGSEGVLLGNIYLVPQRVMMWVVGVGFFTKGQKTNVIKKLLTTPCVDAVFIGLIFLLTGIRLPSVPDNTVRILSNCNTGLSMFLIGMLISNFRWSDFCKPRVLYVTAIRLGLIPGLVLLACRLLHVQELATGICVVLAAMPTAGTTAILAAKYDSDVGFAGSCVTVSTFLSMATIPLWSLLL